MVRVLRQLVICYKTSRNGLAVVGTEELGRRVPQLPALVVILFVQLILELCVSLAQDAVELGLVFERAEDEGVAGMEDDDLLGEVTVVGIVQAVCRY